MYKQFFGLKDNPFNVTPDPRFLYLTPHTEEALACLRHCIEARKGFVMLSGDVGTGKTTLLNKLLEWLRQEQIASAFVFNPRLNPFQFLDYALSDFGVSCASRLKSTILAELNQWLLERYQAGSTAVLIVDEAQDASPELLEEIRLLTNLETPSGKLLQIVLSGQQELEMKLRLPEFRQLRQRISLRCKTYPLSIEETREYVAARLKIAGSDNRQIFTPAALDALHFYSEGIPRVINILCEDSLIDAFADHKPLVSKEIVDAMAHELELDIYPPTAPPSLEPQAPRAPRPLRVMPQSDAPDTLEAPVTPPVVPVPAGSPVSPTPQVSAPRGAPPAAFPEKDVGRPPVPASAGTEEPGAAAKPAAYVALDPSVPLPSAMVLSPKLTTPPVESAATDEEIVQTLKPRPAPVRPQPAPASVKLSLSPTRPFVIAPPPKSKENARQTLILGAAVAFVVVAAIAGTLFVLNRSPHPPTAVVSTPPAPPVLDAKADGVTPSLTNSAVDSQAPPAPASPAEAPQARGSATSSEGTDSEVPRRQLGVARQRAVPSRPAVARRPETPAPEADAAAEPAGESKFGGLVVTANIEGARVSVDGRSSGGGTAPQEFSRLPVGTHMIVVSNPGYEDSTGQVVIQEGRTALFRAQLTPAGGEINILTNPPGLSVSIDGGQFSASPLQAQVSLGTHTYHIKLPNGRIYEGSFEMRNGAIISRRVDFSAGDWLAPAGSEK
jgi:type II secretory pathway predicted ATPase ExeA